MQITVDRIDRDSMASNFNFELSTNHNRTINDNQFPLT